MKRLAALLPGALAGLLISAPLTTIFFLTATLGFPFVPFDFFGFIRDNLPGGLLIGGIETMKVTLVALGLSLIDTAKTAEQSMATLMFVGALVVAAAIYAAVLRWRDMRPDYRGGLALGVIVGLPLMLIVSAKDITSTTSPTVNGLWTLLAFAGWGVVVNWTLQKLVVVAPLLTAAEARGDVLSVEQLDRRRFLIRAGATSAAITVIGAGLNATFATAIQASRQLARSGPAEPPSAPPKNLPNTDAGLQPAPGTRPEYTPVADHYRIDITLEYPEVPEAGWVLPVTGLVNTPLKLTLADLKKYPSMEQYVTLACISNGVGGELIGTTKWTGVSVQKVLADAGVKPDAKYLFLEASDGFFESVGLEVIAKDEQVMFTYLWDDKPLPEEHGFPLRIYIPDRYGMKQPKWITEARLVADYTEGYWVARGWNEVARMKATSVIDTVAVDSAYTDSQGQKRVPVGGIAHAGARSISKVEVKVDDGAWTAAQLRKPLSVTTWVIWRYDWPLQAGDHTFSVRCVDGDGVPQDERDADVFPSGATGIYHKRVQV